ncbi:MAG TPA: nucleotidyltransferase domain-containing protein, partial [Anaerolineales bacterium]|nr:nucleotidyltransferase domain-containing protein [Anaerolineales bacterium]
MTTDSGMDLQQLKLRPHQQAFVERFVKACQADDRVVAAFLGGSNAQGFADAYSDVDLCLITTEQSLDEFIKAREMFLRSLGDL